MRIKLSYGQTINCGNFESIRVDAGIEQDVEKGETPEVAFAKAWAIIKRQVDKRSAKAKSDFTGEEA
jgi:hypothetical protein